MGSFKLQLGAEVDVATKEEVDDAISGLQGYIDTKFRNQHVRPLWRVLTASTFQSFTTGGFVELVFEPRKPAMGKVWIVRRVTVTGADDTTVVAKLTAALYIGDPFNYTLGQLIQPGQAVPSVNYFSNKSVVVRDTEDMFIRFLAGTTINFQSLQISALVEEYNAEELTMTRI